MNTEIQCKICNALGAHSHFVVKEMMFGTREKFDYFQCKECGCLQITKIPEDIARFYPSSYYSHQISKLTHKEKPFIRKVLERFRTGNAIWGRGYKLAKLASSVVDLPTELNQIGPWLRKCNISSFNARFLDIGCGSSSWWLNDLKAIGFRNLTGADPYIDSDIRQNGICILKRNIAQVNGRFDLITLHHSFEHIPDQLETLQIIRTKLKPNGMCLIRIPLVSSDVWERYGTDWVELDAPRHLYLHSLQSIENLAEKARFKLVDRTWDSTEFEFYGSEQYRQGIPLMSEDSFAQNPSNSDFTYRQMAEFKRQAVEANTKGRGGRGCFFLKVDQ